MESYVTVSGNTLTFSCTDCMAAGVHSATLRHGITSNTAAGLSFNIYVCEIREIPDSEQSGITINLAADDLVNYIDLPDFQVVHQNCRSLFDYTYSPPDVAMFDSLDLSSSNDKIRLILTDMSLIPNGTVWLGYYLKLRGES